MQWLIDEAIGRPGLPGLCTLGRIKSRSGLRYCLVLWFLSLSLCILLT